MFPMDVLPDELQHKILYHLPTDDAIRYQAVRKNWEMAIKSWALRTPVAYTPQPQKPLFFSFISNFYTRGTFTGTYAYNTDKERWVFFKHPISDQERPLPVSSLDMLPLKRFGFDVTTSWGLVCFMDYTCPDTIFVCNPILKYQTRLLPKAPNSLPVLTNCVVMLPKSLPVLTNCVVTISTDIHSRKYVVAMVRSYGDYRGTNKLTIQLYESETRTWINLHNEESFDWSPCTCVIHKDILYYAVQFPYQVDNRHSTQLSHGIMAYNLSQRQRHFLDKNMVFIPCAFTCVKLLNLSDKLIMVGGIMRPNYEMHALLTCIKTIGIWEMCGNAWKEIARAPPDAISFLMDKTFIREVAISGCGNLVFLQSNTSGNLLIYELCNDLWRCVPKPPGVSRICGLEPFNGFCFEPRLDIAP